MKKNCLYLFALLLCLQSIYHVVDGALQIIGQAGGVPFYADLSVKLTWNEAKAYCRQNGLYFASVDTSAKDNLIIDYLFPDYLGRSDSIWTCGTDEGNEGNFFWETSGKYFSYTNWHFGNDPPVTNYDRNCVSISGSNQGIYWSNVECDGKFPVICQG